MSHGDNTIIAARQAQLSAATTIFKKANEINEQTITTLLDSVKTTSGLATPKADPTSPLGQSINVKV